MKRFTTILTLLLMICMGAWADDITTFTDGVYYVHNNASSDKYVSNTYLCKTGESYGCQFYIKQVSYNNATCYTIYNLDKNAYVNYKNTEPGTSKLESGSLGDKSYWDINFVNGSALTITPHGAGVSWNFWNGNNDNNPVGLYDGGDGNSKWRLQSVGIVTAASDFGSFKYTVSSSNRGSWAVSGPSATSLSSTSSLNLAPSHTDTKQQFAFVSYNNNLYLYSVGAKKFVLKDGSLVDGPTGQQSVDPINVLTTGNSSYPLFFKFDNSHNINLGGSNQIAIDTWGTIDAGNSMAVLPAGNYDLTDAVNVLKGAVDVTFNVILEADGSTVASQTVTTYRGRTLELPSSMKRGYCTYSLYADAACETPVDKVSSDLEASSLTVYAKCTYSGPVSFSTIETPVYYNLRTKDNNFVYQSGESLAQAATPSLANEYLWAFIGNPYNFKMYNKGKEKYLTNATPTTSQTVGTFTDEGTDFGLFKNNQGSDGHISIAVSSTGVYSILNPTASAINFWYSTSVAQTDGVVTNMGSAFVYPAEANTASFITYVLPNTAMEEVLVVSSSGESLAAPSAWNRDGVTFSYYSDNTMETSVTTATAGVQTIYVGYTYSLSNIISDDTENLKWYRLAASSNDSYFDLYYSDAAPYPYKQQSAFDGSDGYFWAFVGNPFDGFKVYNKAVATTSTMIHNNNTNPIMAADDDTKWYITIYNGLIGFQYTGNTGHRWNDHGGGAATLKYYGNESWHQYTSIDHVDYSGLVEKNIQPFIENAGTGYFKINSQNASSLSAMISEVNSDGISLEEYQGLTTQLNNMISWPSTGYYRIKSVSAETFLKAENVSQLTVGGTNADAASIVYLTGSRGTYTAQMQDKYIGIQSNAEPAYLKEGSSSVYFTIPVESSIVQPGKVVIGGGQTATDYLRVNGTNVVGVALGNNPNGNTACYWTVETASEATIPLNNGGDGNYYATLCLPFDVTVSGATAYTLSVSGNYAVPTEVTNNQVPAGTPLFLKGSSASATATINTGSSFGDAIENALTGTYTDLSVNGSTDYFLGRYDSAIGFYHWDGTTLKANRAYLPATVLTGEARGFAILWDSETTGIESVDALESRANGSAIYNLSGQRVEKPAKGLYIVNGKKVVIK